MTRQLFVTIVLTLGVGYVLGRSEGFTVPYINFFAKPQDIQLFMYFILVSAATTVVLSLKIKKFGKRVNRIEGWAKRQTGVKA